MLTLLALLVTDRQADVVTRRLHAFSALQSGQQQLVRRPRVFTRREKVGSGLSICLRHQSVYLLVVRQLLLLLLLAH